MSDARLEPFPRALGTADQWNWARTHRFQATQIFRPTTLEEVPFVIRAAVTSGSTISCVGSRHSFTGIADGVVLLDLASMPERFEISADRTSVTVNSAMIYSRLAELLRPTGLALANLASLPHITVAGAISTATHGSGDANKNLAAAVRSLDVVTSNGDLRRIGRDDPDFAATPVSLGALGSIIAVELDVVPAFQLEQLVHDGLSWAAIEDRFDAIFGSAYSVSVFTDWVDQVRLWTKQRVGDTPTDHAALHDGTFATSRLHPVSGQPADACTEQGPTPGYWDERLPHFRAGATPSVGAEVQSEFFVKRSDAADAVRRLRTISTELAPILMVSEIRTVQADELWLSPQYERDCVGFHFTWHHDLAAAAGAARRVVDVLAPFNPLPHWGKVFDPRQFDFAALYPRLPDARRVFAEWDPAGAFRTTWLEETLGD